MRLPRAQEVHEARKRPRSNPFDPRPSNHGAAMGASYATGKERLPKRWRRAAEELVEAAVRDNLPLGKVS